MVRCPLLLPQIGSFEHELTEQWQIGSKFSEEIETQSPPFEDPDMDMSPGDVNASIGIEQQFDCNLDKYP